MSRTFVSIFQLSDFWARYREDFDQYIAEDVYFLDVFAHGLSMAIKEARGYNLPVTDMLTDLHSGIAEELKLHNSYQEQSSGRGECKTRHRATTNYTDFLTQIVKTEVEI